MKQNVKNGVEKIRLFKDIHLKANAFFVKDFLFLLGGIVNTERLERFIFPVSRVDSEGSA